MVARETRLLAPPTKLQTDWGQWWLDFPEGATLLLDVQLKHPEKSWRADTVTQPKSALSPVSNIHLWDVNPQKSQPHAARYTATPNPHNPTTECTLCRSTFLIDLVTIWRLDNAWATPVSWKFSMIQTFQKQLRSNMFAY